MAFNKDIRPSEYGKNQPKPRDFFASMRQGAIGSADCPHGVAQAMKQKPIPTGKPDGKVSVRKRMKQG